jgi:hypothetical protein
MFNFVEIVRKMGTSTQMNFFSTNVKHREDQKVVEIGHDWKARRKDFVSASTASLPRESTYDRLFVAKGQTTNIARAIKLKY